MEESVSDVDAVLRPFGSLICKLPERDILPLKEAVELTFTEAELCLRIWIKFGI